MGHYASEMISDDEWAREQAAKKARRERIAFHIKADIDARGIEYVLADLITERVGASQYDRDIK